MSAPRTPIIVESGTWSGNLIRRARKAGRCDYWRGLSNGGRCRNRIEPGDLYLEGEMNDDAGGYGADRYCLGCIGEHEGIQEAIAQALGEPIPAAQEEESEPLLNIHYHCPKCSHDWQEQWSCACDSECPECGESDIQASEWEEVKG